MFRGVLLQRQEGVALVETPGVHGLHQPKQREHRAQQERDEDGQREHVHGAPSGWAEAAPARLWQSQLPRSLWRKISVSVMAICPHLALAAPVRLTLYCARLAAFCSAAGQNTV